MSVAELVEVLVGEETTCVRLSLLVIEVRIGSDDLMRSTLKSPMSSRNSEREGGSSSRVDSRRDKTEESLEGGL